MDYRLWTRILERMFDDIDSEALKTAIQIASQ
jgi:hypothetical protein